MFDLLPLFNVFMAWGQVSRFIYFYELNVSLKITHMYNLYYFCHMCKLT